MEEKVLEQLRFDFYGELLSERQKTILDYYYNDDYSLAEIGDILGITRQGIHDAYKRAKGLMADYEEKLGLVARYTKSRELLTDITDEISKLLGDERISKNPEVLSEMTRLKEDIEEVIEGF
ncbi:YlxM family DNA-binding protein [Eubacterium aggregans]|uniref:YlxM family DNA-binding protein n=1 Tax=Eubacterium aggregans TaxID=81409 RepID=UPI0023F3F73C|nr:sigma factor-like helix-turn-helix DNA-binding protein [Eubacterium aggregans]MDD4690770.1 sigma factor-like helix-turn-helix DNA-binding protein [Eubacterium aggregans]